MDMSGMQCHGCGSTNVTFDPKRRILYCNQCGKEEYYSRATLNANGKVVFAKQNAVRFFCEGKFENAQHYAMDILNISMDNIPALYIMAYYDESILGKSDAMRGFFRQAGDIALEYEELTDLRKLMLASAYRLMDYEPDVIRLIAMNMQSDEDKEELCSFFDKICPYFISKRTSCSYLTPELTEMYGDIAEHCGIPKTCFALLKSIDINPDSPYVDKSFNMKAKTAYFFQNYVLRMGSVIQRMNAPSFKGKFLGAYQAKCQKFKADAGI